MNVGDCIGIFGLVSRVDLNYTYASVIGFDVVRGRIKVRKTVVANLHRAPGQCHVLCALPLLWLGDDVQYRVLRELDDDFAPRDSAPLELRMLFLLAD